MRDDRGVVAIEMALVFPVLVLMFLGSVQLWFMQSQAQSTNYTAQACASAGARALAAGNDAQGAGASTVSANASLLYNHGTFSAPVITMNGPQVTCALSATGAMIIHIFGDGNMTTHATATD